MGFETWDRRRKNFALAAVLLIVVTVVAYVLMSETGRPEFVIVAWPVVAIGVVVTSVINERQLSNNWLPSVFLLGIASLVFSYVIRPGKATVYLSILGAVAWLVVGTAFWLVTTKIGQMEIGL